MPVMETDLKKADPDTLLCEAAENGSEGKVSTLLRKGASPNAVNSSGKTSLHLAAMGGFTNIVQKLLDYGALPSIRDKSGDTPLDLALQKSQCEVATLLIYNINHYDKRDVYSWSIEQNSYSNVPYSSDSFRQPSLLSAVRACKTKRVREAIDAGSFLEEKDAEGNTALCLAAKMGLDPIVSLLLNRGASVKAKNHDGRTAVHLAAIGGFKGIVERLLMNNASPWARDVNGSTPLDLASLGKHKKLKKFLKNKLLTFLNGVNECESVDCEMNSQHIGTINREGFNTLGQTVRSNGPLEKTISDQTSNTLELIMPSTEPPQSQFPEELIKSEDIFSRVQAIAYIKKQTQLFFVAQYRAEKRRFCQCQERRNYHAAKNYKILVKKFRESRQIHRDRMRRRAGVIKRMSSVQPTRQNAAQRKIEHAVERAVKSGGRRSAHNAAKRASQTVFALEKKRQTPRPTQTKKNKKKRAAMTPPANERVSFRTEQSHQKHRPAPVPEQKPAKSADSAKKKTKKTFPRKTCSRSPVPTFVHKPVVSLEPKHADTLVADAFENPRVAWSEKFPSVAYLFPRSHAEELGTNELVKSEKKQNKTKNTKENLPMRSSEEDKHKSKFRFIMEIKIEDLLSAAREKQSSKNKKKYLKKYKKDRNSTGKQTVLNFPFVNKQKVTEKILTDSQFHGTSGAIEYEPGYLEQYAGMLCIDKIVDMSNDKGAVKKKKPNSMGKRGLEDFNPNQKATNNIAFVEMHSNTSQGKLDVSMKFEHHEFIDNNTNIAPHIPAQMKKENDLAPDKNVAMLQNNKKIVKKKKDRNSMGKPILVDLNTAEKTSTTINHALTKEHLAALDDTFENVSVQLEGNPDVASIDKNGTTAVHFAARGKNEKDLASLLNAGAGVDASDKNGRTPLHDAACRGRAQCVRVLLQFGANADAKEKLYGSSPLHLAALRCQNGCVKALIKGGANILITDARGQTPLHVSAWSGHEDCIDILIDRGTPVDTRCNDETGRTALHLAAMKGHFECISILLEKGAEVNCVDRAQRSALHFATRNGHATCVRLLLLRGAAVDLRDQFCNTALHMSALIGNEESISALLERGAVVDLRGRYMRTALHVAAQKGHFRCMQLLLDGGASVRCADRFMNTALHLAAEGNHVEAVSVLVDASASCSAKNNNGMTPLDVAGGYSVRPILTRCMES